MPSSSLPKTYKAVIIKETNGPFKLTDVELKRPQAGQVLVKVLACGVCWTDMEMVRGHLGPVFPRVPGHEIVGEVVELGPGVNVDGITVGARVGGPWHGGHDGTCLQCSRGEYQFCKQEAINGVSLDGGYAEYALLRPEALVRIPKDADPAEVAPLLCAGVTVFNGLRKLKVEHGRLVAVQGLGGLGHLAVQYANKMGYEVAVISSGEAKAEFAKELGAHHYINTSTSDPTEELNKLGGADVIIQTAPNPEVVTKLVGGLGVGGTLLSLAPIGPVSVDTVWLVNKGASVRGWASGHALDSEDAIKFAHLHGVKCLIEKYPLADVQKAVDSLVAGKPRFRNVLVM